jgi:GH15 family glucan-1,4-alpha-glucosidase
VSAIGDYALVGDCHSAALIGRDGSVDWACFPRFDSAAVFCQMLDSAGGHFSVGPDQPEAVGRRYLDDTNVLVTTFDTPAGALELTDCMPVAPFDPGAPVRVGSHSSILRRVRCLSGRVSAQVVVAPRFEYGAFVPRFRMLDQKLAEIVGGADALWISSTRPLAVEAESVVASWELSEGEDAWIECKWTSSHDLRPPDCSPSAGRMQLRLEETIAFWKRWVGRCRYEGDYSEEVRRSALLLKALIFAPSGALVAAPTTSLPEQLGGERNWDYRYTWIRDATLTLTSLFVLGFTDEAAAFKTWLERTGAGRPQDLQIMYRVRGERFLPEIELDHLAGHRGSRPVRIGNGAVKQLQLDCYGQLLEAAYLYGKAGGELTEQNWNFLTGLVDIVCDRWKLPDQGIWEMRDEPRHFIHSKVNCWVALDRAIRIASAMGLAAPPRWAEECDAVRSWMLDQSDGAGWFPQAAEFPVPDASALLVPATGLVPTGHPAVQKTIEVVQRDLTHDGLVHRYLAPDGLSSGEGSFLLCSFWLVDALTYSGRLDEATEILERLLSLTNEVGLMSEEVDSGSGHLLGNFPQAFSHMALVTSCAHLSAARRGMLPSPEAPCDYAEAALDRLLTGAGPAAGVRPR